LLYTNKKYCSVLPEEIDLLLNEFIEIKEVYEKLKNGETFVQLEIEQKWAQVFKNQN
jgi:hypothetical protein